MKHKLLALTLAVCAASTLASDSHPTKEEYRKIFSDVIQKMLNESKESNVCLPTQFYWGEDGTRPYDISENNFNSGRGGPGGQVMQMKALQEAGLVMSASGVRTVGNKTENILSFSLTDAGKSFFNKGFLCYAHADLNRLIKWKGPAVFGEYKVAWVYYSVKLRDVASWAKSPAIQEAFPTAKATISSDNEKVRSAIVDLSSEGWDVNEFSSALSKNIQ